MLGGVGARPGHCGELEGGCPGCWRRHCSRRCDIGRVPSALQASVCSRGSPSPSRSPVQGLGSRGDWACLVPLPLHHPRKEGTAQRSRGRKTVILRGLLRADRKGGFEVRNPEEKGEGGGGGGTEAEPGAVGEGMEDTKEAFPKGPATYGRAESPGRQGGQCCPRSV